MRSRIPGWLWFLLATVVLAQAALHLARPMISYRALFVGASASEVGYVGAAFALLPAVAAVPLGRHAARIRPARLIGAGAGGLGAASILLSRSDSVAALALWSSGLGLAHLLFMAGAQGLTAAGAEPSDRDTYFGWFTAAAGVGQLIGPALGGVVAGGAAPVAAGSSGAATSRALLVAALLAVLAIPTIVPLRDAGSTVTGRPSPTSGAGAAAAGIRRPGVGTAMLAGVSTLGCLDLITVYLPVVGTEAGIGPAAVGALLSLRAATSTASRLLMPLLTPRVERVKLLAAAIALSAPPVALLPIGDTAFLLGVFVALAGLFLGVGQPLSITWLVSLVPPEAQTRALTFRLGANRVGQIIIPGMAGAVAGAAGVGAVFAGLAVLLAVACSATLARSRASDSRPAG